MVIVTWQCIQNQIHNCFTFAYIVSHMQYIFNYIFYDKKTLWFNCLCSNWLWALSVFTLALSQKQSKINRYIFESKSKSQFWLRFKKSNNFKSITFHEQNIWKFNRRIKFEINLRSALNNTIEWKLGHFFFSFRIISNVVIKFPFYANAIVFNFYDY